MFYYWLVPLILLAVITVGMFWSAGRRKAKTGDLPEGPKPRAIRRGEYINK
ncbi:MAG: hypothetical protein U1G07_23250 [Verrucomicrobiota bacterium]